MSYIFIITDGQYLAFNGHWKHPQKHLYIYIIYTSYWILSACIHLILWGWHKLFIGLTTQSPMTILDILWSINSSFRIKKNNLRSLYGGFWLFPMTQRPSAYLCHWFQCIGESCPQQAQNTQQLWVRFYQCFIAKQRWYIIIINTIRLHVR